MDDKAEVLVADMKLPNAEDVGLSTEVLAVVDAVELESVVEVGTPEGSKFVVLVLPPIED